MHWSKASVNGEVPTQGLRSHTSTLAGNKIFVFGGSDITSDDFAQLLMFDPDTMFWYKMTTTGVAPGPHRAHSATLVDSKLFVFGGGDGANYFAELYVLDLVTLHWSKPEISGAIPGPRRAHTGTLINKNKLFIFGGGDGNKALNDIYVLDTDKLHWDTYKTSGTVPNPRGYHSTSLIGPDKAWVFGGSDGSEVFSDLSVLDAATGVWTKKKLNSSKPCFAHSATTVGNQMFVFGGNNNNEYTNDLKIITLDSRMETLEIQSRRVTGTAPAARAYHTALLHDLRIFLIGGYDGKKCYGDTYCLDLGVYSYIPTSSLSGSYK